MFTTIFFIPGHIVSFRSSRKPKMFYLTGSSTNICSIALTLLLIVVFGFLTLISTIYDSKEIEQFKYQS